MGEETNHSASGEELDAEDQDLENYEIISLSNGELTLDAGGDWQAPLRIKIGQDNNGELYVVSVSSCSFGEGRQPICGNVDEHFRQALESGGILVQDDQIELRGDLNGIRGWPRVPEGWDDGPDDGNPVWRSSTAGNHGTWPRKAK